MVERNVIYQGHVIDILKSWPSNIINCTVTSPPYWVQRLYEGLEPQIWGGKKDCQHFWDDSYRFAKARGSKGKSGWDRPSRKVHPENKERYSPICRKCGAWSGDLGNQPTLDMYVSHVAQVFDEVRRVTRDDGTLWLNLGDKYMGSGTGSNGKQGYLLKHKAFPQHSFNADLPRKCMAGVPHRVLFELVKRGWVHRKTVIWHKPNAIPESVTDRPSIDYEFLFMLTKNPNYYYEQQFEPVTQSTMKRYSQGKFPKVGGDKYTGLDTPYSMKYSAKTFDKKVFRNLRSVWSIPVSQFADAHFAVFPPDLIKRPIIASTPSQVCQTCGRPRVAKYRRVRLKPPRRYRGKTADGGYGKTVSEDGGLRVDAWSVQYVGHTSCKCANYKRGLVLDPFMGSGTTALVSRALGRDYLGIELSPKYISMAYSRLTK